MKQVPVKTPSKPRRPPVESEPWIPAEWEVADAGAIQALVKGEAERHQQIRFMKFLVQRLCRMNDLSFRPGGAEAARNTDFAEGKRFIALQIEKLASLDLAKFTNRVTDQPPQEMTNG